MISSIINMIIVILIIMGSLLLQVILSKNKSWLLGLLLPVICLVWSVIFMTVSSDGGENWSPLFSSIPYFLTVNIPTILLILIYFACRIDVKRKKELKKMNVQDLE